MGEQDTELGGQDWEAEWADGRTRAPLAPGLYLVATPIGNLEDITLRALRVLREADRIACEDTRQTQKLLNHFDIRTPTVSYHLHNEAERARELVAEIAGGARIAVVSDAGTPAIADPGAEIVHAAVAAGLGVFPVPGPIAAVAAAIASGLDTAAGFSFSGFLPAKAGARRTLLEALLAEMKAAQTRGDAGVLRVFYEAPHRILETLADVEAVFGAGHRIALARELTKMHEEFLRGTVAEVRAELAGRQSVRGEMVLLLSGELPAAAEQVGVRGIADAIRALMKSGSDEKDAVKQVARERGMGKSEVYREWQRGKGRG
jgi:16S rRNA (cytidine1402-2'-O)-methyltransferase